MTVYAPKTPVVPKVDPVKLENIEVKQEQLSPKPVDYVEAPLKQTVEVKVEPFSPD